MLGGKLHPAPPLYVVGQCAHGVLGDLGAFATIDRGFRDIDSRENFAATTFALDPKRQRGLHGVFGTLEPPDCHGLPDKVLLLGSEVYLHGLNVTG